MQFLSLFTGIGGMDLGLERAGMKCVGQVEINDYCRSILARHWPRVPKFRDIRTFTRPQIRSAVDVVVGGFPCQDVSNAGRKVGIGGERSGLWKEMLRVIRAFRPAYVIVENVAALRSRGLNVVLADLAACGFDAEWDCLPAAAFGAPSLRDRIIIVAHTKRLGRVAGHSIFPEVTEDQPGPRSPAQSHRLVETYGGRLCRAYPADLRVDDGLATAMERIRGCGNAVHPAVSEWVGRLVIRFDQQSIAAQNAVNRSSRTRKIAQTRAHLARRAHLSTLTGDSKTRIKDARL